MFTSYPWLCRAEHKRRYLLTCKVSRYCLLALHGITVDGLSMAEYKVTRWLWCSAVLLWYYTSCCMVCQFYNSAISRRLYAPPHPHPFYMFYSFILWYFQLLLVDFEVTSSVFSLVFGTGTLGNTIRWPNVGWMLCHRLRRWPSIQPTLVQLIVLAWKKSRGRHLLDWAV